MRMLISIILFLFYLEFGECGRILVYSPSLSKSHLISNGRIADALVDAGHEVIMFIVEYDRLTDFTGTKKAKVIKMKGFSNRFSDEMADSVDYLLHNPSLGFLERAYFETVLTAMCEAIMENRDQLDQLRQYNFDVAFSEQIDLCGVGVIRYLGIKNHIWISTTPIMDAVSYNLGIPQPVSYVPTIEENDNSDVMNFWQRAYNMYMYVGSILVHRFGTDQTTSVFRRYDPSFPNVREIAANSSLCFVNSDEIIDFPRPTISKTIFIGGLGVPKQPNPLDAKFSAIMKKGKNGVVIISLGSIVSFGKLPAHSRNGVFKAIQEISDYHFVVRIDEDDMNLATDFQHIKNLDFVNWLPQVDLLANDRLKLFIMHGGINGLVETALHNVPMVVVPVFADQFRNARMVEKRRMGEVLLKMDIGYESFKNVVNKVLKTPSYKQNCQRIGRMMRNKPFSPEERLIHWTKFAIDNGVLEELHVEGSRMNWIVYFGIDILAVFVVLFLIVLHLILKVFRLLCCSKKNQVNVLKKTQ